MFKHVVLCSFLVALTSVTGAQAQETRGLATLIPSVFGPEGLFVESEAPLPGGGTHSAHFNSAFQSQFTQFNVAFASQLASIPLPSPASGFTYRFDPSLGVFERTTESFGPIFADRAETIGKGKFTFATLYQYFSFDEIEGVEMDSIPAIFTHDGAAPGGKADVVSTVNSIETSVNQFALFGTFGLTDKIDVSLMVPIVTADMTVISDATVQRIGTASNPLVHFYEEENVRVGSQRRFVVSDNASGLGDVLLRLKGAVFHAAGGSGLALGLDTRFPTGDEMNLLGSGAWGMRPFAAFSLSGKTVSPHANIAYQWNGESVLGGDAVTGEKGDVPDQFQWSLGLDVAITSRLTVAGDLLGRYVSESPRLVTQTFNALDGQTTFDDIGFENGSFTQLDGAVGLKFNVAGQFLVDFNVLFSLNDTGLRDKAIPLLGFEYTF